MSTSRVLSRFSRIPVSPTLHINETILEMKKKKEKEKEKVFHFGFGQSPFPVPRPMVSALQENAHRKDYLSSRGLPELREAISAHLNGQGLSHFSPTNITIGPGSKQLLYQLFMLFNGDIILPSPSWVSYFPQCEIVGKRVHIAKTSPLSHWHVTPETLTAICEQEPKTPKMLLLNSPCNPTGQVYSTKELKALLPVFKKYNITVIADEIYGPFRFTGKPVSIASIYPEGTIITSGISKTFSAGGWRLGFAAFPETLAEFLHPMDCIASETFSAVSTPVQYATIEAYKNTSEMEEIVATQRNILSGVSSFVYETLKEAGVDSLEAQGGFYMFPDFHVFKQKLARLHVTTSESLCDVLLKETGVALLPGSAFLQPPEALQARLAFVNFDGEKVVDAFQSHGSTTEPATEPFIRQHCPDTVQGAEALASWLKTL